MRLSRPNRAINHGNPAAGSDRFGMLSGSKRSDAISTRLRAYTRAASGWQLTVGVCSNHVFRSCRIARPADVVNLGACAISPVTGVTWNFVFQIAFGWMVTRKTILFTVSSVAAVVELMRVSLANESLLYPSTNSPFRIFW